MAGEHEPTVFERSQEPRIDALQGSRQKSAAHEAMLLPNQVRPGLRRGDGRVRLVEPGALLETCDRGLLIKRPLGVDALDEPFEDSLHRGAGFLQVLRILLLFQIPRSLQSQRVPGFVPEPACACDVRDLVEEFLEGHIGDLDDQHLAAGLRRAEEPNPGLLG